MANLLVWSVGNRNPSITETITVDGVAFNLTGYTVKAQMRAVGSSTLKVDASATVVSAAAGTVRYDWAALDVDTAGPYLFWWRVTSSGGLTQDVMEAVIEFRAHGPVTNAYVELEEIKSTLNLTGSSFADADIEVAVGAASRAVDGYTGDRFYPTTETRYYTGCPGETDVTLDSLNTLTSVTVDTDGNGTYETTWVNGTDFTLDPVNAALEGFPYTKLVLRPQAGRTFPPYANAVKVIGSFGWAAAPAGVKQATRILSGRLLKRARETPYGILVVAGDAVAAARLGRIDPDVAFLLDNLPGTVPLLAI